MKTTTLKIFLYCMPLQLLAQVTPVTKYFDVNQVKARINNTAVQFMSPTTSALGFEVPKGSGKHTIFASGFWVGGLDVANNLHLAASLYGDGGHTDLFTGPMGEWPSSTYDTLGLEAAYNNVWKINKTQIDSLKAGQYTISTMPADIISWPGNGDVGKGAALKLAPFIDLDGDNVYEPFSGDYPNIIGDQALYFILNDNKKPHTESGGERMGVEYHFMYYGFNNPSDSAIHHTLFVDVKMVNRSAHAYHGVYFANEIDFDLGNPTDDYVGTDVKRNSIFVYNGNCNDGSGSGNTYGLNPPAQALTFLNSSVVKDADGKDNDHDGFTDEANERLVLSNSMYYSNNSTPFGDPAVAGEFYSYMQSKWRNGVHMTYGGIGQDPSGVPCDFMFPWETDDAHGNVMWSEHYNGNLPADRRMFGAVGPFDFPTNSAVSFNLAYVYARGTSCDYGDKLRSAVDDVQDFYNANLKGFSPLGLGEKHTAEKNKSNNLLLYPNPAASSLFITGLTVNSNVVIMDISGREVLAVTATTNKMEINTGDLTSGVYFVKTSGQMLRFIKQ